MDSNLKILEKFILDEISKRYEAQGHKLTGDLISTAKWIEDLRVGGTHIQLFMNAYAKYLDKGVKAADIPYTPFSGAGKSKFITGLQNYAKKRFGLSQKMSLKVAFAIAYTQSSKGLGEGMPTKNSYGASSTGKRTSFLTDVIQEKAPVILSMAAELFGKTIAVRVANEIRKSSITYKLSGS